MQHLSYLAVLLACLLGTAPLEFALQARVYRRWQRALMAIVPVAALFVLWDFLAVRAGWWWFDDEFLTGMFVGALPIEELLFFLVIPLCGLLTFEAVRHLKPHWAGTALRRRAVRR
jgi:lycopene beta-cyclase